MTEVTGGDDIPPRSTMPLLDWLRFGAAFMVVLVHAKDRSFVGYSALAAADKASLFTKFLFSTTRYGEEAVLIFFVLSGFLVGGATIKRLVSGTFSMREYAADRTSRIALPLFPAIAFTILVQLVVGLPLDFKQLVANLLCLQGTFAPELAANGPLWTLSYEVWFYILNGAIAVMIARRPTLYSALAILAASVVFSFLSLEYLASWYLGVVAFSMKPAPRRPIMLALSALAVVVAAMIVEITVRTGREQFHTLGTLLFSLGAVALVRNLAAFPLSARAGATGQRLASFSYSLYLIHFPLLCLLGISFPPSHQINAGSVGLFGVRVLISLGAGYLFYLCFEHHTPKVRRWLRGRAIRPSAAAAISEAAPL